MNTDYLCEKALRELNPELQQKVKDTTVVMTSMLEHYQAHFPQYTDHSILHSMQVIDFCDKLIGEEIKKMNADEIYVLLMACYLHDSGMGISQKDYEAFYPTVVAPDFAETHPTFSIDDTIREHHHTFSAAFVRKYANVFDIPSKEHAEAIALVSQGHRRVDLYNADLYPADYKLPNGNTVCLPYLAALIRLADELDIAADRNVQFEYEGMGNFAFREHRSVRHLHTEEERFILDVDFSDTGIRPNVEKNIVKLQKTLDLCADVTEKRTKFNIRQRIIVVNEVHEL